MSRAAISSALRALYRLAVRERLAGADLSKIVLSVSFPGFRVMIVPDGHEADAKMELNG